MGTRNLTMVINKAGETKVAQYGQWDGYPEGQGSIALAFLQECDLDKFEEKINKISWFTDEEIDEINQNSWMETYPWLSRDTGANILNAIYHGSYVERDVISGDKTHECDITKLVNEEKFAGDSLFCEWAYVIDLQKGTFEVYRGFQEEPLAEDERFYSLFEQPEHRTDVYYPVKLAKEYKLDNLPTYFEFIDEFAEEEE